jgi:hypothetical protein
MDLTELQKLIDLLRANGVTSFDNGTISLALGAAPEPGEPEERSKEEVIDETQKALDSMPGNYGKLFEIEASQ